MFDSGGEIPHSKWDAQTEAGVGIKERGEEARMRPNQDSGGFETDLKTAFAGLRRRRTDCPDSEKLRSVQLEIFEAVQSFFGSPALSPSDFAGETGGIASKSSSAFCGKPVKGNSAI